MRRHIVAAAFLAAFLGVVTGLFAGQVFAAGWALTVDTPLSYTFDSANPTTTLAGQGSSTWHNRTTTDVSGSKVLLIAPFHVGVGYEDYSVRQKLDFPNGAGTGVGLVAMNLRIYDVVLDVPLRFLNVTVGSGVGSADTDFTTLTPGQSTPLPTRNASVSQYFLSAGIPLGQRIDLHLGYHWVTVASKDLITAGNSPPFPQTKPSGQMLSAGLRVNF